MKPKIHDLKTWPGVFNATLSGRKTAEYRFNDRNFKCGDYLNLREYQPESETYTGESLLVEITHIVRGGNFGIPEGYCVMSVRLSK